MRRAFWILSCGLALACSSQGSNTEMEVVVWSDLVVPTEMDSVNVDIKGLTEMKPTLSFPLTAGNDSSKSKLPLQISLVPANEQDLAFDITVTGLLKGNPVVSQEASSSCIVGQRLLLPLFLGRACVGKPSCETGFTCSAGNCKDVAVAPSSLPVYTPGQLLPAPDASANPLVDSELGDSGSGSTEAGAVDVSTEEPQFDSSADKSVDVPASTADSGVGDGAGDTGTGGTSGNGDAGVPDASDGPPDVPISGADGGATGGSGGSGDAIVPDALVVRADVSVGGAGGGTTGDTGSSGDAGVPNAPDVPVGGTGGAGGTAAGGTATGGSMATGGTTDTGGIPTTGGTTASGGTTSAAGTTATGGTTAGGGMTSAGGATTGSGGAAGAAGGTAGTSTTPGWGTPVSGGPTGTGVAATVTVDPSTTVGTIGPDFAGFSYEKTHITNGSLASTNTNLIALHKLLGSPMMRLGANDVEVCSWGGTGAAPTQPSGPPFMHTIYTGMVDELCGFLAATGTRVVYGVNFKLNDVTASAAEAAYVMGKCPPSIFAFEIGNEIDKNGSWTAQQTQYESFGTAILAAPGALLAGPGSTGGSYSSFSVPFAESESAKFGSMLTLLTQHYYVAGAGSAGATAASLQAVSSTFQNLVTTMNGAATSNSIPNGYRLGETNTFSGHGQAGVSDTLIAGLWALDQMFVIAKSGGSGVNFDGGEIGMDGTRPFYDEPIQETNGLVVQVQPEYYGMLLFTQAGQGPMVSTAVNTNITNFTAYAVKPNGFISVVLNNRSDTSGVSATVDLGSPVSSSSAIYLEGMPSGSLTAPAGSVTLAGALVTAAGEWNRNPPYIQATSGNTVSVYVPPASAALVRVLQ
jgi:hypothetical protein